MPRYRFHVTPSENLDAILQQGLLPLIGDRSMSLEEPFPAIYLFPDLAALEDAFMGWMDDCFEEDQSLALLAVDTHGMSEFSCDGVAYEMMLFEQVGADKLVVISRDVGAEIDLPGIVHSTLNISMPDVSGFSFSM